MRRKSSGGGGAGWSGRLVGLALCAFFGLGLFSGLGMPGNAFAVRAFSALNQYRSRLLEQAALVRDPPIGKQRAAQHEAVKLAGAVAMVERRDGFYRLFESGEMRGPVSADAEDNLPIISGGPLAGARAEQMVDYATVLVRAEGELSEMISEMRLGPDGEASLFLDRSRTEVVLDLDRAPLEITRAAAVLRRWRGREAQIAALDMTMPGQAVMRLRPRPLAVAGARRAGIGKIAKSGKPGKSGESGRVEIEKVRAENVMEAGLR